MKYIETFFPNPLSVDRSSMENKKLFSEAHIGKLTAQNGSHAYDAMLAATVTAHNNYFGDIADVNVKLGLQLTATGIVDNVMAAFTKRVSRLNSYFVSTGLNKTPLYHTFLPEGVQTYTEKTTKGNIESHIEVLVSAITAHPAEAGGASVLAEFTTFQTDYANARTIQSASIGAVSGARTDREDTEKVWRNQIFDNILDLAKMFKDQPEKVDDFFTQHFLRPDHNSDNDHKGELTGKVILFGTETPVKDVQMHIIDGKIDDAYSKADGTYRSQQVKTGIYKVTFSKPGYISQTITIEIGDEEATELNIIIKLAE